jgi:hypothetical protein
MTDTLEVGPDPHAAVARCLDELAANVPAKEVFAQLRALDDKVAPDSPLRARFLLARGIANNRLGLRGDALGDLHEARDLVEAQADRGDLTRILRAIAVVHTWHGEWRDAALTMIDAIAECAQGRDISGLAQVLIEAGRLHIEIGRPAEAQFLLMRAWLVGGPELPVREREHAAIILLQALIAAKRMDEARSQLALIRPWLADAVPRMRILAEIEAVRIAVAGNDIAAARAALAQATAQLPADDPDSFEHVEVAHAEAEIALVVGDAESAARLIDAVVARYADDDLAGREVAARMLQADALDRLERTDQAERTLAAALRRALAKGLSGHIDEVRSRIAQRGGAPDAWRPGEAPAGPEPRDVGERFVRQRQIASGGYGSVSRAYDLELGVEVAVKRIKLAGLWEASTRDRLIVSAQTEVAAASRVAHPGIARVHGLMLEPSGDALVIEELIEGPTLRSVMGERMPAARALDILTRVAQALAAVHAAGVIHRDLKPDNIILRSGSVPVIVDFGIALMSGGRATGLAGTRGYMAPEQGWNRSVDARADIYSLGVIAHQLLTGDMPDAASPSRLAIVSRLFARWREKETLAAAGLQPELVDLVVRMLEPLPRHRPASAASVAKQLAEAAGEAAALATATVTRRG